MNIEHNERLRDRLSAAYVLGTLKGGARRRFEAMQKESALIQREVAQWQDRLHPLAEFSPAVTPPPHVWQAIERKLYLRRNPSPNHASRDGLSGQTCTTTSVFGAAWDWCRPLSPPS
jgi:anti-sigma-K factor RskA